MFSAHRQGADVRREALGVLWVGTNAFMLVSGSPGREEQRVVSSFGSDVLESMKHAWTRSWMAMAVMGSRSPLKLRWHTPWEITSAN